VPTHWSFGQLASLVGAPAAILDFVTGGGRISCDLAAGTVVDHSTGRTAQCRPVAPEVVEVLESGSLDKLTVERLGLSAKA